MIKQDFNLSKLNWFGIGGNAKFFAQPATLQDLLSLLARYKKERIFILGNGSNILINDSGFDGLVIKLDKFQPEINILDENKIYVSGGTLNSKFCKFACENQIGGLEFLNTIPASIGGSIIMNAGCFGMEVKDVLHSLQALTFSGELKTIGKDEIKFEYRRTNLKDLIILGATFNYIKTDSVAIQERLSSMMEKRRATQPVGVKTCGSTFKNPLPHFAGKLIEEAGLKGFKLGGVEVSQKHANFLINSEKATAEDIKNMIKHIQDVIKNKFNILLDPEVHFLD